MALWTCNDLFYEEIYISDEGETIQRKTDGMTPNRNEFWGQWAYYNVDGELVDWNQYRHDLFERNNIDFYNMAQVYHEE